MLWRSVQLWAFLGATTKPLCQLPGLTVPFSQLNLLQGLQFWERPAELDYGDYAQTNWEARAIFHRSSSSNHAEVVALGNGSQAEWEARACWDLPSRRASQDVPFIRASQELPSRRGSQDLPFRRASQDLQGFAVNQHETYQEATAISAETALSAGTPTKSQGDMQQAGAGAETPNQTTSSGDQLGLQRVAKQTAAAAALQKALSNIQDIATGSQQARAAAAALAETTSEAEVRLLSQTLQQDAELFHGHSPAAADTNASQDSGNAAMVDARTLVQSMAGPEDSSHLQMGMAVEGFLSTPVSAAAQVQVPAVAVCLAEESSSNGSHFSLDADSSPDQSFDMTSSAAYAADQLFKAQLSEHKTFRETDAEHVGRASLSSAQPMPHSSSGPYLADLPAAVTAAALSEDLVDSGSPAQADLLLGPQPQAVLQSRPSSSAQLPAESAGAVVFEQLERGVSPIQVPTPWPHSSETAATADSSALLNMQATAQRGIADRQTPDATAQVDQTQPVSDIPPETVGWSGETSSSNAALQSSQGPSAISTPSNVLSLGEWSSPQIAPQLVLPSPNGDHPQQLPEPASGEGHTLYRAEMVAHDSCVGWRNQQIDDGQTRVSNSRGEGANSTYATGTMTHTPQVAACLLAAYHDPVVSGTGSLPA